MDRLEVPRNSPRRNSASPNNSRQNSPNRSPSNAPVESRTFENLEYPQIALNKMRDMQVHHLKCDLTMVPSEDTEIPCHKVVVMAGSPYLESKLRNDDARTLIVMDVTREAAILLLEYIYTGRLRLNMQTVGQVLPAAELWQISDIRGYCIEFLLDVVAATNYGEVLALAQQYDMPEVLEKASTVANLHRRVSEAQNQEAQGEAVDPESLLSED